MEWLLALGVLAGMVILNAFFMAAEFALVGVPQARLAQMAEDGSATAGRVLAILKDNDRLNRIVATAQVGIALVVLGLGMYGEPLLSDLIQRFVPLPRGLVACLSLLLLAYPHVVLGQVIPKALAVNFPVQTSLRLTGPLGVLERLFWPAVVTLNAVGNRLLRMLRVTPVDPKGRLFSPEELEVVVEESHAGGLLDRTEELFIKNIFDFQGRTVSQVMTPRIRVLGIPLSAPLEEVLTIVHEHRYTRYPVYDQDLDHLVGILHIKDLARQIVRTPDRAELGRLLRPALFVPISVPLEEMLQRFRQGRTQMAVVVDEFGGTAGLVTVEDVVEEVVGEIQDEFDQEIPPIEKLSADLLRVRGDVVLEDLAEEFGLTLEHPEVETVGGVVMAELGRVPVVGDRAVFGGLCFEVEEVTGMAVQTVLVRRYEEEA
ncbi:MAG: hemolysin family protein [Candidatus Eremiobacterota bacterium]